jgi:hypothetical protein
MTGYFASLPEWQTQSDEITKRIISQKSHFKILLKIKDDHFFFDRWVRHHASIVGMENIVIFDNMSTSKKLEDLYQSYGDSLNIFRFSGFHNKIHRVNEFSELYESLKLSCQYFQFLDSDEYLVYIDSDGAVCHGPAIVDKIVATGASVNPASWLENVRGCDHRFWWDMRQNHPLIGLRSGKPIISSNAAVKGLINHNWQVCCDQYESKSSTNFFVLHLKRLSIDQRIKTNIRKLHAYNAFKGRVMDQDEIRMLNADIYPPGNKRNWIKEIQDLSVREVDGPLHPESFREGMVEFGSDGRMIFSSPDQETAFYHMLDNPWGHIESAFSNPDDGSLVDKTEK